MTGGPEDPARWPTPASGEDDSARWPTTSSGEDNVTPTYDPPALTTLTPATAVLGAPNFTLHVGGSGFKSGAVILWNGGAEPTTFVSETELTTDVNMATATVAVEIPVAVANPGGAPSASLPFTAGLM